MLFNVGHENNKLSTREQIGGLNASAAKPRTLVQCIPLRGAHMIKAVCNAYAPLLASAGIYGVGSDRLGGALLVIMALAVILNQLWTLFDKARRSIRSPETTLDGLTAEASCGLRRRDIGRTLDQLRREDARQDALNKDRFDRLEAMISGMKTDLNQDIKGLHSRSDDVLRAVSRLEGKVNQ